MAKKREHYSDLDGLSDKEIEEFFGSGTPSGTNVADDAEWWNVGGEVIEVSKKKKHHKGVRPKKQHGSRYQSELPALPKCRHYHKALVLPNGIIVQGSSDTWGQDPPSDRRTPDFGLYCDHVWRDVEWRAEFINFPDYRAPKNYQSAAEAIVEAYGRAMEGWLVETGCVGGHGRTGTVLACWVILAGVANPQEAMKYVWSNYCTEAIESKEQVRFVDWFAEYVEIFGQENNNG